LTALAQALPPIELTNQEKIALFGRFFIECTDVHAVRWENNQGHQGMLLPVPMSGAPDCAKNPRSNAGLPAPGFYSARSANAARAIDGVSVPWDSTR